MISGEQALQRLREGNRRFVEDRPEHLVNTSRERRRQLTGGQEPFAIILGCSDSRVPAELVFDQGLGDLFVVRVAGNVAASSQIGSIEFAASHFGTRLVVVLGHSCCGAVKATLEALRVPASDDPSHVGSIVNRIAPAVQPLIDQGERADQEAVLEEAVQANVLATVQSLQEESPILQRLARDDGLLVVGAEYHLDSGEVTLLEPR